jgi:hypothetical protein
VLEGVLVKSTAILATSGFGMEARGRVPGIAQGANAGHASVVMQRLEHLADALHDRVGDEVGGERGTAADVPVQESPLEQVSPIVHKV